MLTLIDDRIPAGYGDFSDNTGPIHAESVAVADPTGAWTDHFTVPTEQIGAYRQLADGRIVVSHVDPQGASTGGYSERDLAGVWHDRSARFAAQHVFDMAEVGGRLFACGADGSGNAIVWASTDGGATWGESLRSVTSDLASPDFERFYMLATVGAAIYVQSSLGLESYKWTLVGGWTADSANLVIGPKAAGAPGVVWRDGYIYPHLVRIGSDTMSLYYFDGSTRTLLSGDVRGYSVAADGSLYLIDSLRKLRRISATGSFALTTLGTVEQIGSELNCSLCVAGGTAVIGTNESRLKAVTLP